MEKKIFWLMPERQGFLLGIVASSEEEALVIASNYEDDADDDDPPYVVSGTTQLDSTSGVIVAVGAQGSPIDLCAHGIPIMKAPA